MDSWGGPNPSDRRHHVSETDSLPSPTTTTIHRQPSLQQSLRREQSETLIPFVSSTATPPYPTSPRSPPPPAASKNEPALWQLGRHSIYKSSIGHDQPSPTLKGQFIYSDPEGDGAGKWNFDRVQHQVDKFDESKLIDVEGDLQRGLKARQVRLLLSGIAPVP